MSESLASVAPTNDVARLAIREGVLDCVIDSPPVNALGQAVREALLAAVNQAARDPDINAIVIRCAGRTFFADADIREFGQPAQGPSLPEVVDAIEASAKPVIAAIHGTALGGGLEVALGCHYRVALSSARMGFPEVKLGMLPGAGGTQRLPRLAPMESALGLMTSGSQIDAPSALALGFIDQIADDNLEEAAFTAARRFADGDLEIRRTRDRRELVDRIQSDHPVFDQFLTANKKRFRGLDAPFAVVKAARAAVGPSFEQGLAKERALFLELRESPKAAALRHVFFAEREASKIPDIPTGVVPRKIKSVGIVGAGTMGSGIAINFLQAGFAVLMVDTNPDALRRGNEHVRNTIAQNVKSGRLSADHGARAESLFTIASSLATLLDADLIIEAAFETIDVKREVFAILDVVAKPGAILATNTSYLDVDEIAAVTVRPRDVVGLHFFSPANIMKLLEIVRARETAPDVIVTALDLARKIGKVPVVAGVAYGFIGNRMLHVRRKAVEALLLGGISLYRIDEIVERFGMPMGPFRMYDLAGLDLGWSAETSRGATIQERLCEQGRRGQKTGAGYYDYDEQRRPVRSPLVETLIADFIAGKGAPTLDIGDDEVLARILFPMIDEGYRILDEGKAYRASDIDTVWINGYGWPAWTGGPMYHASQVGYARVITALEAMGAGDSISQGLRKAAQAD